MKDFFQKIMSITIALVVLFSTFSFTVHQHFCGDELKDTSLFVQAEKCAMEMGDAKPSCELHKKKKPCCEDKSSVIEGQDELKITSLEQLSFDQELFVAALFISYINLFEGLEENIIPFNGYPPPLLVKNIHKLDEVYLI